MPMGIAAGRADGAETLVFINYRSSDAASAAAFLHAELSDRFGPASVFLDYESIPLGRDFVPVLLSRVRGCAVLLVVVGDRWLDGDIGQRPIDNPGDWVRREILEALEHNVPVLPVLVGGGKVTPDQLPVELAALTNLQYFEIRDRRLRMDIHNLGDYLVRHIPRLQDHRFPPTPVGLDVPEGHGPGGQGTWVQNNIAYPHGTVFAVQRGDQEIHREQ